MKKLNLFMLLSFGVVMNIDGGQFNVNKEVKLPSKSTLIARLNEYGLEHFVSNTDLINVLVDDKVLPVNASLIIDMYLNVYGNEFQQNTIERKILAEKVYKCVFNGNPGALKYFGYK